MESVGQRRSSLSFSVLQKVKTVFESNAWYLVHIIGQHEAQFCCVLHRSRHTYGTKMKRIYESFSQKNK